MSSEFLAQNQRAGSICANLGGHGMRHVEVKQYLSNGTKVHSATAIGDCGSGEVTVTAIVEGDNRTYLMQGPAEDGEPGHYMGPDLIRGTYYSVAMGLFGLLSEHPEVGGVELSQVTGAAMTFEA
jgi:hypothetical protein